MPNLKSAAGGVLRRQSHVGLDDGDLALLDDQHRDQFDADEKRIQSVGAVEQRVVLQADAPAVVEERLKILIVVVQVVLVSEQYFDDVAIRCVSLLSILSRSAKPPRRLAMSPEGSGSPSNVVTMPTMSSSVPSFPVGFGSMRTQLELLRAQSRTPPASQRLVSRRLESGVPATSGKP